ncbi:MAG TPA: nucleotidyltransferase family protein, partial [Planctomycetota bacterium]|nr:nucleotidyltransferase family protein [Planctomycetota bacterium]
LAGPALPEPARTECAQARARQAERSGRLLAALKEILDAFRAAGVRCLLLKGLGLGARHYGGLDRRATRDLDLLVRDADLRSAERALEGIGFRRASIVPLRALALRFTHAFDYVRGDLTVDLHWTLARHPSFHFDLEGLGGRSEACSLGGVDVQIPCAEDALALAAIGAFRDIQRGAFRARALADLYRIAASCGDLAPFLARCRADGTRRIAANVFALLLHALDARAALPAVAAIVDAARADVIVDPTSHLRLFLPGPFALGNRLFAIRLYACSPLRSFLWWLLSMPVRLLAFRSWRLPSRRRRRG